MLRQRAHNGPLDASIGTTFSASMSESVDIDVVEQIISRARDATSFAQVHDAYTSVLETHGIRPSTDKAYYQFLLKLGMIRASTWGERWDVWRAQNNPTPLPKRGATQTPNPMRARVPFLASASSDLDEGYADESDAGSDVPQRQSPRKAFVARGIRSLVGYTPAQSEVDEESFDVPVPIRTSTPVFSQTPHRKTSPIPPTYSESELETSRSMTAGFSTPKPRRTARELNPAYEAELEAQADAFHRLGLLGRCFEVWLQSEDWIRRTTERIDAVRDNLLLRETLTRWRDLHDAHLMLPGTADAHYAHRLQQQAIDQWLKKLRQKRLEAKEKQFIYAVEHVTTMRTWQTWRRKLVNRRTEIWAADLKRREAVAATKVREHALRGVFDTWRDRARTKQADVHYVTVVAERHFETWRARAQQSRSLSERLDSWKAQHSTNNLASTFRLWRGKAVLQVKERQFSFRRDTRVMARSWTSWRVRKSREQMARTFNDKRLMRNVVSKMTVKMQIAELRQRKARKFVAKRNGVQLQSAFNTWARNERGRLLAGVIGRRRLRSTLGKWKGNLDRRRAAESRADAFAAQSQARSMHSTLSRWRAALGQRNNAALKADLIFEARTKSRVLMTLQAAAARATDNLVTADKAYAFFALRSVFKVWRKKLVRRRVGDFIVKRQHRELGDIMRVWQDATAQSILDRRQVEAFQATQDKRLIAAVISRWTERVVEIKARELDVAEHRDGVILHDAFRRWTAAHRHKKDLEALLESHLDIKREDHIRRAFLLWLQRARRSRDLTQKSEFLQKEWEDRLKAETFVKWYDLKRERDLQTTADEVALRREDALLFSVFDAMLERTPMVRGIQYDKQRMRKSIFPRWQRALQRTREVKRAAAEHDRRLLVDAFAIWRTAFKVQAARKRVPRRRRVSSRVELPTSRLSPDPVEIRKRPPPRPSVPASFQRAVTISPDRNGDRDNRRGGSVASEPAYDRLRNELRVASSRRIVSDEHRPSSAHEGSESRPTSALVRALQSGRR